MAKNDYNHQKIEKKWQKEWDKKKIYKTLSAKDAKAKKKKPQYILDMFPYPSGAGLHVGHPRGYIGSDVFSRVRRMQGFNVLHPMGYDAFGLPAEQYAIEHKIHPRKAVEKNVATFEKQLSLIGLSYDWSRKVNTTDPEYYKWTQWIFLQLFNSWYDTDKKKARPVIELIKIFEKKGSTGATAYTTATPKLFTAKEWKNFSALEKQEVLMHYRLAYEGESEVNWCQKLGTVLANDEVVENTDGNSVSERGGYPVEKIRIKQWFLRITAYAERLLQGLPDLKWSLHLKEIQKNWIGKSEGAEITFPVEFENGGKTGMLPVFTTRADTLFGATALVLSPEHVWVQLALDENHKGVLKNRDAVKEYVAQVGKKTEMERMGADKEKTGIKLLGVNAINPATQEKIPIFVADYVLASYGTGAVMSVPAHDERDFTFAKKYNLPIKEVIEPLFIKTGGTDGIKENMPFVERQAIVCIVKHWNEDKYLCLKWKKNDWQGFVVGGIEDGEKSEISGAREITEETGYKNPKFVKKLGGTIHSQFYHEIKKQNRFAHFEALYFELQNGEHSEIAEEEKNLHEVVWISKEKVAEFALRDKDMEFIWKRYLGELCYTGDGIMVNSGKFDGLSSEDARKKITEAVNGKFITRYKMRDAVFARQRYWGEPIPLYRDKEGILHEVKKLPLTLPNVKSYEPTGRAESPLAGVPAWTKKGYETNTMPGWAGSSWYFLRYMDPKNKKALASDEELSYWKKVDVYVGGAEHATGHLLYSRFWNKFLKDIGISKVEEPFLELHNQGLIMATDGRKMSKRWGNVINPDDIVKLYGADTLRIYEMFMGPFDQAVAWSTESIIGSRRFLERVWRLSQKVKAEKPKVQTDKTAEKVIHKTIKKVGEDIEIMNFNTAISALMICINEMEKAEYISVGDFKMFLQILAPFAPHMTEEIWREMDEKKSIHISSWPKFDSKKTVDEDFTLVIQVNGKVRAEINAPMSISEAEAEKIARNHPAIQTWIEGKTIRKVIYVKNKLVNIVAI